MENNEQPKLSNEVKRHFLEIISTYNKYQESLDRKSEITEIAETLGGIVEVAEHLVMDSASDWFDKVTIKRNMVELKKLGAQFDKVAIEAKSLDQRLGGLYEDMGHILSRYYKFGDMDQETMNKRLGINESLFQNYGLKEISTRTDITESPNYETVDSKWTNQTGAKSSLVKSKEATELLGDKKSWALGKNVKMFLSKKIVTFTDGNDEMIIFVGKPNLVIKPFSKARKFSKQLYNESINESVEVKVGDFVSKKVKHGPGHTSGTEGYIFNLKDGGFQLTDQWGGYDERKVYNPKGFKIGKKKSKQVSVYKPVLDLIKKYGNTVTEGDGNKSYSTKMEAMNAFFKSEVTAKELKSIAFKQFGVPIATKKELNTFLGNSFMIDMMSSEHGIKKSVLVSKVKELLKLPSVK